MGSSPTRRPPLRVAVLCLSCCAATAVRENSERAGGGDIVVDSSVNLLLGPTATTSTKAACKTARVGSSAETERVLTEACDVDFQSKLLSLGGSTTVHLTVRQLGDFAAKLRAMPEQEQVTAVLTGASDPKMAVVFPNGLLADTRLVRIFRAISDSCAQPPCEHPSSTVAEQQEEREEKLELLRTTVVADAPTAATVAIKGTAAAVTPSVSAQACTKLTTALERMWGTHEAALLTADPTGLRLAKYYNATNFTKTVPTTGAPYNYYHYSNGVGAGDQYCEPTTIIYPNGKKVVRYDCYRYRYSGGANVVVFIIYVFLFTAFIYLMFECTLASSRVYYGYEEPPDRAKRRWSDGWSR